MMFLALLSSYLPKSKRVFAFNVNRSLAECAAVMEHFGVHRFDHDLHRSGWEYCEGEGVDVAVSMVRGSLGCWEPDFNNLAVVNVVGYGDFSDDWYAEHGQRLADILSVEVMVGTLPYDRDGWKVNTFNTESRFQTRIGGLKK